MQSFDLKDKILRALQSAQAPLPKGEMPGYWWSSMQERVLTELVAQGSIVVGPNIPHRTWALPEFRQNTPKV